MSEATAKAAYALEQAEACLKDTRYNWDKAEMERLLKIISESRDILYGVC